MLYAAKIPEDKWPEPDKTLILLQQTDQKEKSLQHHCTEIPSLKENSLQSFSASKFKET
jgi:hypothetical protein